MIETPILIAGGGPIGLTLAGELGWRGSACTLVEERTEPTKHPKPTLLGARSMEYFRRWGITDQIFAAALKGKIKWMARQFNSAGTHLGCRYVDSPVIVPDGTPEPPDDFMQVVPSTWPGSRAPHGWVGADQSVRGQSTLDWFGHGFVLLHPPGNETACAPLSIALQGFRALCRCEALPPTVSGLYQNQFVGFVLVRPDGHVCWRGEAMPEHPQSIAAIVTGHAPA